jgi:hypothetical protein
MAPWTLVGGCSHKTTGLFLAVIEIEISKRENAAIGLNRALAQTQPDYNGIPVLEFLIQ